MNDSIRLLEEKIAYLERHVTEQDKAMLELADEIAAMRRELKAWRERGESRTGGDPSGADATDRDERPPHY